MNSNEFDLAVVGGGVAGCSAALRAARMGLKVVLIEKSSLLGGLATAGLINWFEPLCDGRGKHIIYGQAEEFIKLALKYGYKTLDGKWLDGEDGEGRYASSFDHSLFALSLTKLLVDAGVVIHFESLVTNVSMGESHLDSITISCVDGNHIIKAKTYIDSSGSGVLFRFARLSYKTGDNYLTYATMPCPEDGKSYKFQNNGAGLTGAGHPSGLKYFRGDKQEDVDTYLVMAQQMGLRLFEEGKIKSIAALPSMPQFRKIAALKGDYVIDGQDEGKSHEDSIAVVSVFNKPGCLYELPYGALFSSKVDNLLTAGRVISAVGEAWEAYRVIPCAVLTGEVAANAATLMVKEGVANYKVKLKELRDLNSSNGIKVSLSDLLR